MKDLSRRGKPLRERSLKEPILNSPFNFHTSMPSSSLLLAIETASDVCSVALLAEGVVIGSAEVSRPRAHAALLAPLVRDVLAHADASPPDLDVVAVSAGPGSFTGLRIGVSTAKGLAFASGAALVAVPTLDALAASVHSLVGPDDLLLAALPSRREETFAGAFALSHDALDAVREPAALAFDALADWLPPVAGTLWVVGEPGEAIARSLPPGARVLSPLRHRLSATEVARIGWARYRAGAVEDVAAFEPAYLKPFEARRGGSIFDRLPR